MDRPETLDKQEKLKHSLDQASTGGLLAARNEALAPAEIHPRELLLRDLSDREQRLLDKLVLLREQRRLVQYLDRREAQLLVDAARIERQLSY